LDSLEQYQNRTRNEIREILVYQKQTSPLSFWETKTGIKSFDITSSGCCIICYESDPLILEQHHVAGKHNSTATVTVCPSCHRKLSVKQTSWPVNWTNKNNIDNLQFLFLFAGLHDLSSLFESKNIPILEFLIAFAIHKKERKKPNSILMVPLVFGLLLASVLQGVKTNGK
jgi:hypothetical protein